MPTEVVHSVGSVDVKLLTAGTGQTVLFFAPRGSMTHLEFVFRPPWEQREVLLPEHPRLGPIPTRNSYATCLIRGCTCGDDKSCASHELTHEEMELFASDVMPRLRVRSGGFRAAHALSVRLQSKLPSLPCPIRRRAAADALPRQRHRIPRSLLHAESRAAALVRSCAAGRRRWRCRPALDADRLAHRML